MRNTGNWGTGLCANGRNPFNFEWDDRTFDNRKRIMDFMDAIPTGSYVVVRKILDQPFENEIFAAQLKADEQVLGAGNSLYHRLKNAGFAEIDSFSRPRTYAFVYKKNDANMPSVYRMTNGLYDRIQLNLNLPTTDTLGYVTSPVLGPAREWKTALWAGSATDNGIGDRIRMKVIGIAPNGSETYLFDVPQAQGNINLSGVNARQYPSLKLQMENIDSVQGTPWNLNWWRVYYTPVPEGALAANILLQSNDYLAQGQPFDFMIVFKNISSSNFDSLKITLSITDNNNVTTTTTQRRRPLPMGDTLIVSYPLSTSQLSGLNTLFIAVNPDNDQPEQYFYNNFLYKSFFVDGLLPLKWIQWTATKQTDNVLLNWKIIVDKDIARYYIEHSTPGSKFISIGFQNGHFASTHTQSSSFSHTNPAKGINYYRLRIEYRDGSTSYSSVEKVLFDEINGVRIAPNPFNQYFTLYTLQSFAPWNVRIFDANGKLVKDIKGSGTVKIDMQSFASGSYWLEWQSGTEIQIIQLLKQ
jgi:hypothetical protein